MSFGPEGACRVFRSWNTHARPPLTPLPPAFARGRFFLQMTFLTLLVYLNDGFEDGHTRYWFDFGEIDSRGEGERRARPRRAAPRSAAPDFAVH